eukprot:2108777-Amphidinium_carterae.1
MGAYGVDIGTVARQECDCGSQLQHAADALVHELQGTNIAELLLRLSDSLPAGVMLRQLIVIGPHSTTHTSETSWGFGQTRYRVVPHDV